MRHVAAAAVLCLLSARFLAAAETQITIAGSTTVFPIVDLAQKAYAATHPGVTFAVGQGGSGAGIEKVGKGDIQLGMTSRDLKDAERKQFPDLQTTRIGTDGLAIVVNAGNPVNELTKAQVADVYVGKIADWKDLGGAGAIGVVSEQEKGGTLDGFKHHFKVDAKDDCEGPAKAVLFKLKDATDWSTVRAKRASGTNEILAAIIADPGAIGFASVGAAERLKAKGAPIKLLAIDGKSASVADIAAGTYTLTRPLLLVTKGEATGEIKNFVEFILSADGQALVSKADFIATK